MPKDAPRRSKISLIGTHGVGKTVLTFSLAGRLRASGLDCDVAYENSRKSPFPINEGTTLEGQLWILAAQWKEELEASLRTQLLVCDRSVIDNYAYLVRASGRQPWLHDWIAHWLETYDALFLVPAPPGRITRDSKRSTSRSFQREIHGIIEELAGEFRVGEKLVRLPEERTLHMSAIVNALRERGLIPGTQRELV